MSVPARKPDVATLQPSAELWGPLLIAGVALLLAFPAGLLLAVINWYRMGMLAKSRSRLIAGVVAAYAFVILLILLPNPLPAIFYFAVNIGAFFYLRREVDTDTDAYAYAGNEVHPANRLTGIAIGIGGFLFFVLVYIVMVIFFVAFGLVPPTA
jgi:hypothetical protein